MADGQAASKTRSTGRSLIFAVTDALALAIMSRPAGTDRFPAIETRIQKQHGVSRSTVREAAKILAGKGLLSTRPRRGTRMEPEANWNWLDPDVLRWSRDCEYPCSLVRELTEFRLAVEPMAAAMAATAATVKQKHAIKAALNLIADAEIGEEDPLRAEIAFHRAILDAANNRFFAQAGEAVETGLYFGFRLAKRSKAQRRAGVLDYARIYRAIDSGNGEAAQRGLRAIILETLDRIPRAGNRSARAPGSPQARSIRSQK